MWLRRAHYDQHLRDLATQRASAAALAADYQRLHQQFLQAHDAYQAAQLQGLRETRDLFERLITAEGEARKASALIAVWQTRVNQIQRERDELLRRALPMLDIHTPHLTVGGSVRTPELSFEHDAELAADQGADTAGLIPLQDEDLGGAAGEAYTRP